MDRRGSRCDAAFCREHWSLVGGIAYCRRHAGTVRAFGPDVDPGMLPDLDNRGPSLVNWVATEIDPDVTALLHSVARAGELVTSEPTVRVIFGHDRRRRWERSWKVMDSRGISLKVSLTVNDGADDAVVEVQVGSEVVARGIPPWIARRRTHTTAGADVDAVQRQMFHSFILDHITGAVARYASTDPR